MCTLGISRGTYSGPVAQWIRHLTTNQGIPGSSPGRVVLFIVYRVVNGVGYCSYASRETIYVLDTSLVLESHVKTNLDTKTTLNKLFKI